MYHIYDQTFIEHICNDIKFIVGIRNHCANTRELINKRPKKYLLTNHHHKTSIIQFWLSQFSYLVETIQETQHKRNITGNTYKLHTNMTSSRCLSKQKQNQQLFYISDKNIVKTYQIQSSAFNSLQWCKLASPVVEVETGHGSLSQHLQDTYRHLYYITYTGFLFLPAISPFVKQYLL